jgi:DNA-binding response OmpR family regulator
MQTLPAFTEGALASTPTPPAPAPVATPPEPFRIGNAFIDPESLTLRREGQVERLTKIEFRLLRFLHDHPNQVWSRDELYPQVWGYRYFGTSRTLDQFIVKIRRKLGDDPIAPTLVVAVRGAGYQLALPQDRPARRVPRNRWSLRGNPPKLDFKPVADQDDQRAAALLGSA